MTDQFTISTGGCSCPLCYIPAPCAAASLTTHSGRVRIDRNAQADRTERTGSPQQAAMRQKELAVMDEVKLLPCEEMLEYSIANAIGAEVLNGDEDYWATRECHIQAARVAIHAMKRSVTLPRDLEEALRHLKLGMAFAYGNGLHEFGYDPVETVRAALTRPPIGTDEVVERVARALFKAIYPTGTTWEDWERHVAAGRHDGFDGRDRSRELARAAIAAMPTIPPQSLGAIPGSHPTDQAPSGLGASRFDPERWNTVETLPRGKRVMAKTCRGEIIEGRTLGKSTQVRYSNTVTDKDGFRHPVTHWKPL